jgi:hypothetical protein
VGFTQLGAITDVNSSGSLAILAAIRRALVGEKHDLDQRRERACPSIGLGREARGINPIGEKQWQDLMI